MNASQATEETPADATRASKPKSPSFLSKLLAPLKNRGPRSPKKEKTESEVSYRPATVFEFSFAFSCWSSIKNAFVLILIRRLGHSRWRARWRDHRGHRASAQRRGSPCRRKPCRACP